MKALLLDFPCLVAQTVDSYGVRQWIMEVDKGLAVGVATGGGWSQSDSAVSLHKSWQGLKPLKTEAEHSRLSHETH